MDEKNVKPDPSVQSLQDDWNEIKEDVKQKFPGRLSDNDLHYEAGKEEELIARLEDKLELNREQVIDLLWSEWSSVEKAHLNEKR